MSEEEIIIIIAIVCVFIGLIPMIFFLLTLQNTLKAVSPENRRMSPGQVWLVFIPVFGVVWQFIVVNRIADSLADEFYKRNILNQEARPGYSVGIAYCILGVCSIIPFLGTLASLAALVCWIVYWVKVAGYKRQLESLNFARAHNILDANSF